MEKSKSRNHNHTLDEWFDIITECRQSGLSDNEWCLRNGIPRSTLAKAAMRLRAKAYAIPERMRSSDVLDFTSCQEVVKIDITQDNKPAEYNEAAPCIPKVPVSSYLDNSHTIEIQLGSSVIRLSNDANPSLVRVVTEALIGGGSYVG